MTTKGEGQGWASASAWAGRALEAWGRAVEGDGDVVKAGDDLAAAVRAMSLAHGGLAEAGAGALEQELAGGSGRCDECDGEGHVEVDTCALCESSIRATCPKCKGVPR